MPDASSGPTFRSPAPLRSRGLKSLNSRILKHPAPDRPLHPISPSAARPVVGNNGPQRVSLAGMEGLAGGRPHAQRHIPGGGRLSAPLLPPLQCGGDSAALPFQPQGGQRQLQLRCASLEAEVARLRQRCRTLEQRMGECPQCRPQHPACPPAPGDIAAAQRSAQLLSAAARAEGGKSVVRCTPSGAVISASEPVLIRFHSNALLVADPNQIPPTLHPMPYGPESAALMADLLSGYLPGTLQADYPQGVAITVENALDDPVPVDTDEGHRLGKGSTSPPPSSSPPAPSPRQQPSEPPPPPPPPGAPAAEEGPPAAEEGPPAAEEAVGVKDQGEGEGTNADGEE
eukprot:Hpha_TRINITY_DN3627_c0_g1::TRINITY_DN3627_c0_g1_i1::g.964::m.964